MKKIILTSAVFLFIACLLKADELPVDTTFRYNQKIIKVEEGSDQLKVKVLEENAENGIVQYKQLYEGIFSDEKSYEKWTVQETLGFDIPFISRKKTYPKKMMSHWGGIGLGFANITDKSLNMSEVNGVKVDAGSSHEWFINFAGKIIPVYRNNLGITTGAGIGWLNLRLNKKTHLSDIDGVTGVYPAPDDIRYLQSRLMIVRINIPFLLEWQPTIQGRNNRAFVSAGIVAGVKTHSSYLIKYKDPDSGKTVKNKDRGLNTTPLSLDYMAMAGCGPFTFYAKYSPLSIFLTDKGPDIKAVSLGMILRFHIGE